MTLAQMRPLPEPASAVGAPPPLPPPIGDGARPTAAAVVLRPPIAAIRWGTVAVGVVLASPAVSDGDLRTIAVALGLSAYAAVRTWRPLAVADRRELPVVVGVLVEVGLHVLAVLATGGWNSPFVFSLITAVLVAGFARGLAFGIRVAVASAAAVGAATAVAVGGPVEADLRLGAQWACQLVLVAAAAGYARRLSGEAEARHSLALDRLGRLAEANSLLYSLHRVAQTLPASLDLDEVLDSTTARLREFFDVQYLAILLPDDTSPAWLVARAEGVRLPRSAGVQDLPPVVREATACPAAMRRDLDPGTGVAPRARSGLYAPLRSRAQLIGVLVVEADAPGRFAARDVELLDGFTEAAALAIDNARWFRRLRSVGADEERTRIARELHDRVGQSLAYLAFETDRLVASPSDADLRPGLEGLRGDLRGVLGEVRDTLYDLRTDVSEARDIVTILEQFLKRVTGRSSLSTPLQSSCEERLPLRQEREMWRIAQEAVTNAERHARATSISVTWRSADGGAALVVADDGRGFDQARAGRPDSYGLLGMRERAAAIGATLNIESIPGRGTTVRCDLPSAKEAS